MYAMYHSVNVVLEKPMMVHPNNIQEITTERHQTEKILVIGFN